MKKMLLFMAVVLLSAGACSAQYLYGTCIAGAQFDLIRFNPVNNSYTIVIKGFNYTQPVSTKDSTNKIIYFMVPNLNGANQNPDTLVTVKLSDSSVAKRPFVKGSLPYPQFYNGRLISICSKGMAAFDLATNQYSLLDTNVRINTVHSADFDRTRGRYICMNKAGNSSVSDTIFTYTLATRVLNKYPMLTIGATSNEMCYSPTSNKAIFLGVKMNTSAYGVYSFDFATQQVALQAPLVSTGTLVNCSTFDEVNNRYFCVKVNNTSGYNILEYKLNTNTAIDHMVGAPAIGFPQYFDNQHIPHTGTGIGLITADEPFKMYPNPAGNQLNITIDLKGQQAGINILDLTGKVVLKQEHAAEKNIIDISALANGKYVMSIVLKDKTYSRLFDKSE